MVYHSLWWSLPFARLLRPVETASRAHAGPVLGLGYAVVLTLALLLAPDAGKAFIYFQF